MAQSEPEVIIFLVGNKLDMADQREVSIDKVEQFKRERNIEFSFETSALTGENIEDLFIIASKLLYNNFKDKIAQMVSKKITNLSVYLFVFFKFIERRSDEKKKKQKIEETSRKRYRLIQTGISNKERKMLQMNIYVLLIKLLIFYLNNLCFFVFLLFNFL